MPHPTCRSLRTPALLMSVLGAVALFAPATPAQAAAYGAVTVSPNAGSVDDTPMFALASTAKPCPAGFGQNVTVRIGSADGKTSGLLAPVAGAGDYDKKPLSIQPTRSFSGALRAAPADGAYLLTLNCADQNGVVAPDRFETRVTVAAGIWTADSAASSAAATTTTLAVSPAGKADKGAPVTLTATVAPAGAAGTVTFRSGGNVLLPPTGPSAIPVTDGRAELTVETLVAGAQQLVAVFTPTDAAAFLPSTSAPVPYQIGALTVPVPPGPEKPGDPPTSKPADPDPPTSDPPPPGDDTPPPSDPPSPPPAGPEATPEPTPTPAPVVPAAGGVAGGSPGQLPITGPAALSLVVAGLLLVVAGAAAVVLTRRPRQNRP